MKHLGALTKLAGLSVAFAAAFFANSLSAANSTRAIQGEARVERVTGVATYAYPDGKVGELTKGTKLKAGAIITTGKDSKVNLWLGDNGEELQVEENATLILEKLELRETGSDKVADTELTLKTGGLSGNVKKLSSASKFQVKTPNGVAGIRGTSWAITPNGVACGDGAVNVTFNVGGVQSAPFTVPAGMMAIPPTTPGGVPTLVPAPPDILAMIRGLSGGIDTRPPAGSPDGGPLPPDIPVFVTPVTGD